MHLISFSAIVDNKIFSFIFQVDSNPNNVQNEKQRNGFKDDVDANVNRERIRVDIISTWKSFYVFFFFRRFILLYTFCIPSLPLKCNSNGTKFWFCLNFSLLEFDTEQRHNGFLWQHKNYIERKQRRKILHFNFYVAQHHANLNMISFICRLHFFWSLLVSNFAIHFYVKFWMGDTLVNATKR